MHERQDAFRFWWPQSRRGSFALGLLVILAFLTFFRDPYFFWVNVVFWYFAALLLRLVLIRLIGTSRSHDPKD